MSLSYTGHSRELWAQMTLRPGNSAEPAQSLDAVFTMDQDFKSTSLDAVWAVRHGPARTVIVLANTSDRPLLVQVAHPNAEREVTIAPQSVRLVNPRAGRSRAPWTRIHLQSDGAPAALRATGFVMSGTDRVPRLIRFSDPAAGTGPSIFATGVRSMHVDGTIAVRGTTSQTVLATATILDPTTGADLLTLPGVPVDADTGGLIDLGPSLANLGTVDRVAVRVTSSGGTGSIIGALTMDDTTDAVAYEMPLRDPGPLRNSARVISLAPRWRLSDEGERDEHRDNASVFHGAAAAHGRRLHPGCAGACPGRDGGVRPPCAARRATAGPAGPRTATHSDVGAVLLVAARRPARGEVRGAVGDRQRVSAREQLVQLQSVLHGYIR